MKGKQQRNIFVYLVIIQLFASVNLIAQESSLIPNDIFSELQNRDSLKGTIVLYQDASLSVLIDKNKRIHKNNLKGYRIQLYRGSGQKAREKANLTSQRFMSKFPDFDVSRIYAVYETPYFKLRIGDFRTKNEAYELLHQIKKYFRDAYIVNSNIKYPKLDTYNDNNSN